MYKTMTKDEAYKLASEHASRIGGEVHGTLVGRDAWVVTSLSPLCTVAEYHYDANLVEPEVEKVFCVHLVKTDSMGNGDGEPLAIYKKLEDAERHCKEGNNPELLYASRKLVVRERTLLVSYESKNRGFCF